MEVTWGSKHCVGNFCVNMFSPHVEYILLGRSLEPPDWPPYFVFFFLPSSHPCHVRAIEDATFWNQCRQIGAYHGSAETQHCFLCGCIHQSVGETSAHCVRTGNAPGNGTNKWLTWKPVHQRVANFYFNYPFQLVVVQIWRHSLLYVENSKFLRYSNQHMPRIPGVLPRQKN